MGPHASSRNSTCLQRAAHGVRSQDGAGRRPEWAGAFFAGRRHDRFPAGQEPGFKVYESHPLGRLKPPGVAARSGDRGSTVPALRLGPPRLRRGTKLPGLLAVPATRSRRTDACALPRHRHSGSAASRSALHPTRLETRTKESGTSASHGASSKPKGAMKVKAASGLPR